MQYCPVIGNLAESSFSTQFFFVWAFIPLYNHLSPYYYVWHIYPMIPQTLGGGRPRIVKLLVAAEKASAIAPYINDQQSAADNAPTAKSVMTPKLNLLYITNGHYYLQSQSGVRLSLSAGAVEGVVWNPH